MLLILLIWEKFVVRNIFSASNFQEILIAIQKYKMEDLAIVFHRVKRRQDPKLELKEKGIGIIPQDLFALTFLEVLDLSNNKIISIDAKISNLKNLIFLDLSNNQITSLPQAIL
jgi:Leucine-rich repeat (LRR) protein